jgi:hypothetical protein
MATKQLFFFAEIEDLQPILEVVESDENIQYCEAGIFDFFDTHVYYSSNDIPNLGYVDSGDWNHCKFYAVYPKGDTINKRIVPLKKGGVRYAIYQDNNPRTVILKVGGIFKEGVLVGGSIGTISGDPFSLKLFNTYSKLLKRTFTKIGTFYVGSNAKIKLEKGWRLVTNDKSPKEYDLKI